MGLFISYCKDCKVPIHWFLDADDGIRCTYCGKLNTKQDLISTLETPKSYQEKQFLLERIQKINKIRKKMIQNSLDHFYFKT